MAQIKISEKTRDRWALVNDSDREILMLEFSYQGMKYVKDIRSVAYFFFVLAFLGVILNLFI